MPITADTTADSAPEALHAKVILRSSEFRLRRQEDWLALEALISRAERRGIKTLSAEDLQRLPVLYRSTVSALSVARSIALDRALLNYLENLSLRAFLVVYGPRGTLLQGMSRFFTRDFPVAVRAAAPHLLVAFLVLAAGIAAGFLLTASDESWFNTLMPSGIAADRGPESTREDLLTHEIFAPWDGPARAFALFANTLFQNNTMVGVLAFSLGLAAGVPTILLLLYNGLSLGAFVALHYNRGLTVEILGWLSIHGVTEITAILLCGAGGLLIADKIVFPGRYSRLQSLGIHGRVAAQIAIGAMLLFFVAAILEGGFRQLVQSTPLRFAIGWGLGALWLIYFVKAGREGDG
jgi:uncharacterized membrane protein SpoIIM required for sporulation